MLHILRHVLIVLVAVGLTQGFSWDTEDNVTDSNQAKCNIKQTYCREVKFQEFGGYSGIARSGYLKLNNNKKGSGLGFSFFGVKDVSDITKLKKYPTILILGGGPGASSQINNLQQSGPFQLKKVFTISVVENKFTWAKSFNLLYIDQPVGTGVSCLADPSHLAKNLGEIIDDLYYGLVQLYTASGGCFNELGMPASTPLYIFGESYGGKYAPALGVKLLSQGKSKGIITGFKGIGIGDGFTAPSTIFSELGNHAFSMGLLDYQQRIQIEKILLRASIHEESGNYGKLFTDFWDSIGLIEKYTGVSIHDMTKDLPTQDIVGQYFSNSSKLSIFGFQPSIPFQTLNGMVIEKMKEDFMKNQYQDVQKLLSQKIPVLIYQGQDDLIVSVSGTMKWVEQLNYSQQKLFKSKNLSPWKVNGTIAGFSKSAGSLTLNIIKDAGHFVPVNAPQAAYEMVKSFITANS